MKDDDVIDGLLANSMQLSWFILFAAGVSVAAIAIRLAKKDELDLKVVKVPLRLYWIAAIALTTIHLYLGLLQVDAAKAIERLSTASRASAWFKLTQGKESPILFRSMQKRPNAGEIRIPFVGRQPAYAIHGRDNTLLLSLAFVALASLSLFLVHRNDVTNKIHLALLATSLGIANWFIGGLWAVAVSNMQP